MKFKTLFQRRSNSSMAESDISAATSVKRKKKETKALTTSMKSGTKIPFIGIPRQEKCSSCSSESVGTQVEANGAAKKYMDQPQPDESVESCENCGIGCEKQNILEIGNDDRNAVAFDVNMKLNDNSSHQTADAADTMDMQKAKKEVEEYKEMLLTAHSKIKELTDEVEKMKMQKAEKNKEFNNLHDDFMLCMRSAERFRVEAEMKAWKLEQEVVKLRKEISEHRDQSVRHDSHDGNGETCRGQNSSVEPLAASFASPASEDCEAVGEKKLVIQEERSVSALSTDDFNSTVQVEDEMNESSTKPQEEKLRLLRKTYRGSLRNGLLNWCQIRTQDYENVEITNFSTSWSNGLALAAVIHSLNPDAFEYSSMDPKRPVDNFETALKAAEKLGVKKRLNAVKIIVESENPPWEPIFAYVTQLYLAVAT